MASKSEASLALSTELYSEEPLKKDKVTFCMKVIFSLSMVAVTLSGCAFYQPKPLNQTSTLTNRVPDIKIDAAMMPLPELRTHVFDPSDGLDITEVAMLAVVSNADLILARDDAGIAQAQAFAAGLLPDPQITLMRDYPLHPMDGQTIAYNQGISYAINTLLTYNSSARAARSDAQKADLNLLWQEWQVIAKARVLFVRLTKGSELMETLGQNRDLFLDRYNRTQTALDRGLLTLDAVTPHLVALQDVRRQINDLERQLNQNRLDLNALLSVAPEVHLQLVGPPDIPKVDEQELLAKLPELIRHRPDVVALEAGYRAQNQRYRVAILNQFPSLNLGLSRARDTSNVETHGFNVGISLPIFSRGRGDIAVAVATRQRMYDEYQQRINTSESDVHRILDEQRINMRQLREVTEGMKDLDRAAVKGNSAFSAGNIDSLAFANLQSSLLAKKIEKINLEQAILEQQVGLQALVGSALPTQ